MHRIAWITLLVGERCPCAFVLQGVYMAHALASVLAACMGK